MTTTELRAILATMLASVLGTYSYVDDDGVEQATPALSVTEPPAAWRAAGLEVRIAVVPRLEQVPAYVTGAIREAHRVTLISHDADADALVALRKILSRWSTATVTTTPGSSRLGILSSHNVIIPA
jgi:hypothetical protein